jgi:tetratricopeptide (TPR) repeat protein
MTYKQREEQSKLGQRQSEEAVELAMRGCWEEAAVVNQGIIESTPGDVSAYNRLGKALFEMGEFHRAMEAYDNSLKLETTNAIAIKNLARLRERLGITVESSSEVTGQVPQPVSERMTKQNIVAEGIEESIKEEKSSEEEEDFSVEEETFPEGFSLLD